MYFTRDLERTSCWFREVLGWYGDIAGRNEKGEPEYGCVFDYPGELMVANLTPFRGEPFPGVAVFLMVQGLDRLRRQVLDSGWEKVSEIREEPWGARECRVTTVDGSILRFFEVT